MRPVVALSFSVVAVLCASLAACSGGNTSPGFGDGGSSSGGSGSGSSSGGSSNGSSGGSGNSSGGLGSSGSSGGSSGGDSGVTTKTTVYANSDHNLFSVDPMTKAVTLIGAFSDTTDTFTDVAVNGNGDVYVNTESAVFKCTLPSGGTGAVQVAQIATIGGTGGTTDKFYALAFAPAGAVDPNNEVLIGGDRNGVLWSIDTSSGATKQLGSFGTVNNNGTMVTLGLSGDMVFYTDGNNNPVGLATIRASSSGTDWLAGIDMSALKTAYSTGTPAATLLKGVYGGSGTSLGNGTTFHDVFGLGAWNSTVFGFTRSSTNPQLITIDTNTGVGTAVPGSMTFPAMDSGWSGAGVTTKVTVNVPQPPPPPQ